MLASNFTENINYNTHKNNNNNEQLSAFTPIAVTATSTPSSSSSSLDYLYQAITLIEETKNNTTTLEPNTKKQNGEQFTAQYSKQCTNPCCNCKSSKTRNETLPLRVSKQHREDRKAERQNLSKYKKIKTYHSNYTDNKPSIGQFVANRLEKEKILARKSELRLNISSDPLTPVSSSSLSPQSVKSSISPTISPFLNQSNQSTSAFNYYPIEILPNLLPFYYTPFNQSAQVPQPQPPTVQTAPLNNDPNYLHNLISTIYSIANYQQMQHLHTPLQQTPLLNNNNLILYSIQQQLQHQQQQQQRSTLPSPIHVQAPKTTEPIVKSKLISYINESDIENKVNEHFRRSLGSKYIKISHKLTRTLSKPKKRPYRDENNNDYEDDDNDLEASLEQEQENDDLNTSGVNYDDYDETFIEYSNDSELERQPFSPVSTVSADSYSSQAMLNDLITQNELYEDDDTCLTSAATNNTLLYSPVSSNSIIDSI